MNSKNKRQIANDDKWNKKFSFAQSFINQHFRYPSYRAKDKNEASLSKWITHQKYLIKLNKLPEERLIKFKRLNFPHNAFDKKWMLNLKMTIQFIKKNDTIPSINIIGQEHLGLWYYRQYSDYQKGKLNKLRKTLLEASSILDYKFKKDRWQELYKAYDSFIQKNRRSPKCRSEGFEKKLANWYVRNKGFFKRNKLPQEKAALFKKLLVHRPDRKAWIKTNWMRYYNDLLSFKKINKRLPLSTAKDRYELRLYFWLMDQRKLYRDNRLSTDQINKLRILSSETFNFKEFAVHTKEKKNEEWLIKYTKVEKFCNCHGRFPMTFKKDENERKLGDWCKYQKQQYHKGKLSEERYLLLKKIGFNFIPCFKRQ